VVGVSYDVLILGGGGREDAFKQMFRRFEHSALVMSGSFEQIAEKAKEVEAEFVVIGPEDPLVDGIVDYLRKEGIPAFGPSADGAKIEGDKSFFRSVCEKAGVPIADGKTFTVPLEAMDYIEETGYTVVKYPFPAGGKGVVPALTERDALATIEEWYGENGKYKGKPVIIEKNLNPDGKSQEASFIVIVDEDGNLVPCITTQDHKREGEGDTGRNTGGMGAYGPAPIAKGLEDKFLEHAKAIVSGIKGYTGILYGAIIISPEKDIHWLEINCRAGDPEWEAIAPLAKSDPYPVIKAVAERKSISGMKIDWSPGAACDVVIATKGYPDSAIYKQNRGHKIYGLDNKFLKKNPDHYQLVNGAIGEDGTNQGGRVAHCVGIGADIMRAQERAYNLAYNIWWQGCWMRRDIATRATDLVYSAPGVAFEVKQ
jgi:phosphoribosylamine--glycine ligase